MAQNPETQIKLSESKISSRLKLIDFQTYQQQKKERQQIQSERKNIELYVANLYRETKKASKQLNNAQLAIVQKLNRKSSKQQYERQKEQFKRLKDEQLHQLKNNNSLSRYMNILKRQQAKRRLIEQNKQMSLYIKEREIYDQKLKKAKTHEENQMLFQKNIALEKNNKMGVQLARVKSLLEKKTLSSVVRQDLITLENIKIQRQKQTISSLTQKQKQLGNLFRKAKHQKVQYESILNHGKHKSFIQMYEVVAKKEGQILNSKKKRKSFKKKRSNLSQQKILSSYFGIDKDF